MDFDGGDIFFQVRGFRGARNGQHDWTALEKPGESDLARSSAMCLGYVVDRAALRKATGSDWSPGDETDAVLLAIIQHVFAAAIDEIVAVLNSRHFEQLQGGFDDGYGNVAQPSVTDDAIVLQRLDGRQLLVARHFRIDAVELPKLDPLKPQPLATLDSLLAQVLRAAISSTDSNAPL